MNMPTNGQVDVNPKLEAPGERMIFGLFGDNAGNMRIYSGMPKQQALRLLVTILEDLREQIAVELSRPSSQIQVVPPGVLGRLG